MGPLFLVRVELYLKKGGLVNFIKNMKILGQDIKKFEVARLNASSKIFQVSIVFFQAQSKTWLVFKSNFRKYDLASYIAAQSLASSCYSTLKN